MEMDPVKILVFIFFVLLGVSGVKRNETAFDDDMWDGIRTRLLFPKNFVSVRINSHNEKELRIGYNKVLTMETSMESGYSEDLDMVIKQATDGHRLVQAVYQGGLLKECDFTKDSPQILDFVSNFVSPEFLTEDEEFGDVLQAYAMSNSTRRNYTLAYRYFNDLGFLKDLAVNVGLRSLRKECQAFVKVARALARDEVKSGKIKDFYAEFVENTDQNDAINFNKIQPDNILKTKESTSNHKLTKRSTEPLKRSRKKRAAFDFNSVLIFPGTKWCGKGDLASCYDDLGDDQELDACCRDHDCCPYIIPPFTRRYNMFNYRFHSLLHCDCDQRFRGCLRQSVSSMASMIGKIYFNILGSKCFEFVEVEVCVERSWWGRCTRYEKQVGSTLQNQVSFNEKTNCDNNTSSETK